MVRLRNFLSQSCHLACSEPRREPSEGSAFLRPVPASSSPVLKMDLSWRPSAQIGPSKWQLSAVLCHPRRSFPSATAPAAGATVFYRSSHQYHSMGLTAPLFSYSYALFCTAQNAISNHFCSFRTLRGKHPGWGRGRPSPLFSAHTAALFLDDLDAASTINPLFATLTKNTGGGGTCLFSPRGSAHSASLRYPLPLSCFPPTVEAARPQ
jgi:hypothetical protein